MGGPNFDKFGRGNKYILLKGLNNNVLNYNVIRGFAPITTLAEISNAKKYQRDIDKKHALEIKDYLNSGTERFFPEIIIGINTSKLPDEYKNFIQLKSLKRPLVNSNQHYDQNTFISEIKIFYDKEGRLPKEVIEVISRIDGNHRLYHASEFKDKFVEEQMVSFCIIDLSEDDNSGNEEIIFHLINNKAKPLLDDDNLKVIIENKNAFSDSKLKIEDESLLLTRYLALENMETLKSLYENFGHNYLTRIYEISKIILESEYIDIKKYEDNEILKKELLEIFGKINSFYDNLEQKEKIQKLQYIVSLIVHVYLHVAKKNDEETRLWLNRFVEWLDLNGLFDLTTVNYHEIWRIFYKIYESKSNKVFISMEFNDKSPDTYDTIEQVIKKINADLGLSLEPIKIDEYRKGVTYSIPEEIITQIRDGGLLIGDLTNKNANVYHEIGYMMGICHQKGIEEQVILILKMEDDDKNPVKFNLAHKRQIRFKTYVQLRDDLYKELKSYCKKYKIGRYHLN